MKKLGIALVLCRLLLLGLPALVSAEEEPGPEYFIYYLDSSETKLEGVAYDPSDTSMDGMIQEFLVQLNDPPASHGRRLFPEGLEIQSYEIAGDVLRLSFPETYQEMSRAREILVRAGTVRTFVQVPGIRAVIINVDGEDIRDSKGSPVGELTADSFVSMSTTDLDTYRYDTFTLYFTDEEGNTLLPETRTVYYRRSIPKARVALEQLAMGPMEEGHFPVIPNNSRVLSVTMSDDVCYADFDSAFLEKPEAVQDETVPIFAVVNTLISATDADKVQITVGGEGEITYGEATDLYNFFGWNEDIVTKEAETE